MTISEFLMLKELVVPLLELGVVAKECPAWSGEEFCLTKLWLRDRRRSGWRGLERCWEIPGIAQAGGQYWRGKWGLV